MQRALAPCPPDRERGAGAAETGRGSDRVRLVAALPGGARRISLYRMAKKGPKRGPPDGDGGATTSQSSAAPAPAAPGRPSAVIDTRVIYCGDNLEQLAKLPDRCVDLIYIDPPFNSNRNYEVFWGETRRR